MLHSFGLQHTSLIRRILLVARNLSPKNLLLSYLRFSDADAKLAHKSDKYLLEEEEEEEEGKSRSPAFHKHLSSIKSPWQSPSRTDPVPAAL